MKKVPRNYPKRLGQEFDPFVETNKTAQDEVSRYGSKDQEVYLGLP